MTMHRPYLLLYEEICNSIEKLLHSFMDHGRIYFFGIEEPYQQHHLIAGVSHKRQEKLAKDVSVNSIKKMRALRACSGDVLRLSISVRGFGYDGSLVHNQLAIRKEAFHKSPSANVLFRSTFLVFASVAKIVEQTGTRAAFHEATFSCMIACNEVVEDRRRSCKRFCKTSSQILCAVVEDRRRSWRRRRLARMDSKLFAFELSKMAKAENADHLLFA